MPQPAIVPTLALVRSVNPLLAKLQPYPFEKLRQLFAGVTVNPEYAPVSYTHLTLPTNREV